jgi:uracil-DNA glycosylase family 4
MSREVDLNKVARQHLEMDGFFAGFAVRGKTGVHDDPGPGAADPPSGHPGPRSGTAIRSPQSSAEAAQGLAAIAAEVARCRRCQLGSSRRNSVPGEGSPCAKIMFIGEAPGADEDAQGRPFVGRAGQLLDKIIAACGLQREEVFIGNILKCRPPENRDPRPEEIINCLPYLQMQIEAIDPEIIVALGGHAAKTLLNTPRPISQLRGQFQEYYGGLGRPPVKLMATFHPAYLLRNYSEQNRRCVWEDMKKVLTELGLPVPEHGKG